MSPQWQTCLVYPQVRYCLLYVCNLLTYCMSCITGIILCMRPANERRRYNATPSPVGWVHTQKLNDPRNSISHMKYAHDRFVAFCYDYVAIPSDEFCHIRYGCFTGTEAVSSLIASIVNYRWKLLHRLRPTSLFRWWWFTNGNICVSIHQIKRFIPYLWELGCRYETTN